MREGLLVAGKYKLLKLIGTGGMGAVWLARNEMTEREFAIKFLHPSAATNPKVLTRFLQEAKVSGRLRHPSILEIFDVGVAPELEGAPFLVMELLDGAPLDVAIRLLGEIPLRVSLQIVSAIARSLVVAHDKGIVHRDIKPANVFLHRTAHGTFLPKLLDFGISKLSPLDTSDSGMGLTQTGAILGSPLYMSPEQAAGDKHVDGRSDIHGLGVLMWWCIVGKSPFRSTTYNTLVVEIITGERPRIEDIKDGVPEGVGAVVAKAFARRREERFETTAQLADALDAELEKLPPGGPAIESKAWNEEVSAKLRAAQSMHARQVAPLKNASTTGAVSVSLDDVLEDPSMRSPAAYTVDSKSAIALAPTEHLPISSSSGSSVQGQTAHTGLSSRPPRRMGMLVGILTAAVVLSGAAVVGGIALSKRGPQTVAPTTSGGPTVAGPGSPEVSSQVLGQVPTPGLNGGTVAVRTTDTQTNTDSKPLATTPPDPPAPATTTATTPVPTAVATPNRPPTRPNNVRPPPVPQAQQQPTAHPPAPTATPPDIFHGITNPGLH